MKIAPAPAPPAARHVPSLARAPGARARSFLEVVAEGAGRPSPAPAPSASKASASPGAPSELARGLRRALEGVAAGEARVDALLDAAARGKTFTAGELLAMQATVFRYSQTIEVLTRATDRLVGAVKQTLGTQV
jgi:hypothetical protein